MKKNWIIRCGVPIHVLKKVFLVMKLTFLLMIMLQVSSWATGFSQESRVSLQMKDVSLEKVILELRDQTGIRFFYSIDKIKSIEHLSIIATNEIYARYGYRFSISELQDHFNSKLWYVNITNPSNDIVFSDIEDANLKTIVKEKDSRVKDALMHDLGK